MFYPTYHSNASNIAIEENMPYIELDIIRSYGTFGEITITLNAVEGSAVSPTGKNIGGTALLSTV